jgi:hypothetical protein
MLVVVTFIYKLPYQVKSHSSLLLPFNSGLLVNVAIIILSCVWSFVCVCLYTCILCIIADFVIGS